VGYDAAKNVILGGSGESFDLPYNGLLDNVRFYNRAITGAEVSQLYSQDPSCVTTVTTGIKDLNKLAAGINVYPNPSQGLLNIDFGSETTVELFVKDMLGKVLLTYSIENQTRTELDLSSQPNGIYFVEVYVNGTKQVQKIIKN
jgi:hypothetical protein